MQAKNEAGSIQVLRDETDAMELQNIQYFAQHVE